MIGHKIPENKNKREEVVMEATWSQLICYLTTGAGSNFYARVIVALQLEESNTIPYMAVGLRDRHIRLFINPKWVAGAEYNEVLAVLEHEALHVVLEHLIRILVAVANLQSQEDKITAYRVIPLAVDMETNLFLDTTNDWVKTHRKTWVLPDQEPFNLPRDKTFEWYLKKLMERDKKSKKSADCDGKDGGDNGEFHNFVSANSPGASEQYKILVNHEGLEELLNGMSDEEKCGVADELKHRIKDAVQKAVDDHAKSRGTLPAFLEELIGKLLAPPKVPWTQILRDRVINTKRWKWRRSVARPNRRHVGVEMLAPFPGRVKDRTFTVAFCIDTSGSMGVRELEIALSELQHLQRADSDIEIHVIEADVDIGKEYLLTSTAEVNYNLTGRGGTDFNYALKRSRELKPDMCFYYTDGYAPAPNTENRVTCPMMWLISPGGKVPDTNWGYVLQMADKEML